MKLVTFLKDHGGYVAGASQWYDEVIAEHLIKVGIAKDAYAKEEPIMVEPEVEEKQVEKPKKDKMVRAPRKKK